MRDLSIVVIVAASVGFAGVGPAVAGGGMGDPSASMREMRAICDAQRRGEYPRTYDACLPGDHDKSARR
jgi:hypothetical protein